MRARESLMALPLVANAKVRKFYPNRLLIEVSERQPAAIWQNGGKLSIVSADGKVIDDMRDQRFAGLPFVVGDGANRRAGEFAALLEAAGDLRSRIRAGTLVSERRWTLKMTNNVDAKLPERIWRAVGSILWHEFALIAGLLALTHLTMNAPNPFSALTFAT